ncbi:MAG: DUF1501 domain-containing protein [Planctomycetota bacterium]|nr:DUF1501 domain-containing protein [Planctomycetota bacterium]
MFSIFDSRPQKNCDGYSRREWLRVGSLSLLGANLPQLLSAKTLDASRSGKLLKHYVKDRAVVLLFLHGGPSHIEFFDPSMESPSEIRSITGEIQTRSAGITFGSTFEKLAKLTDQFSIVRSFGSQNSGHTYEKVASGNNSLKASMSSIYGRVAGTNNPRSGIPNNILVKPESIQKNLNLGRNFETNALPSLTDPGEFGKTYQAFDPGGGGDAASNMELKVDREHFLDRKSLLKRLDQRRRNLEQSVLENQSDALQHQALDIIYKGIGKAFDLDAESESTRKLYDTAHLFRNRDLQRYGDMRRTTNLLGQQMLLARRLCEAGCGFVTVSDCGWDMHANGNSPKGMKGIWPMSRQVDHAVAAFIQDVNDRGLQDKILLIVTGEMGRTPRINKNGGRDHYGELTPILFSGGGLKMGQVIGRSDHATKPATTPYDPSHLFGTVMHSLFDIGEMRLDSSLPSALINELNAAQTISPLT